MVQFLLADQTAYIPEVQMLRGNCAVQDVVHLRVTVQTAYIHTSDSRAEKQLCCPGHDTRQGGDAEGSAGLRGHSQQ